MSDAFLISPRRVKLRFDPSGNCGAYSLRAFRPVSAGRPTRIRAKEGSCISIRKKEFKVLSNRECRAGISSLEPLWRRRALPRWGLRGALRSRSLTSKESSAAIADASSPLNADSYFGKWAFEIPDEAIAHDKIVETIEADVVVVGAGTGGLTVANSVAEEDVKVVLISASSKPISRGGSNHARHTPAAYGGRRSAAQRRCAS